MSLFKRLFLCLLLICYQSEVRCFDNDFEEALAAEIQDFFKAGRIGPLIENVTQEIELDKLVRDEVNTVIWPEAKVNLFCTFCSIAVNVILKANDAEAVVEKSIEFCVLFNFGTQTVCEGLLYENQDEVLYILSQMSDPNGNDICGVVFAGHGCSSRNPEREWKIVLPRTPKPPLDNRPYPKGDVPTMKILHLSDTHFDPLYTPGTSIDCADVYLCCREESGTALNSSDAAGYWGSYGRCDAPKRTIEALYQHITQVHKDIDLILWTGDIIPHSVWKTSRESNLEVIREMAELVKKYFPETPVFPAVGNHEGDPVNQFAQPYIKDPEFDMSWLYDELAEIWGTWLPKQAARSVARGSYYTVQVKPGLHLISLNTNYCYNFNWWLLLDSQDIAKALQLIAFDLQRMEENGHHAYIIGHIPSGNRACSPVWSHEFSRIVSRYEDTISGIFFAHTHKDHFQIFYDPEDPERAYEVGFIGQSQTPYHFLNPGYKIYTVEGDFDGSKQRVIDHDNYILDLASSNDLEEPIIYNLYSAKQDYGMEDLSPRSYSNLVSEMNGQNSTTFAKFYRNYAKGSPILLSEGCDDTCKFDILCELVIADNSDHTHCKNLYPSTV